MFQFKLDHTYYSSEVSSISSEMKNLDHIPTSKDDKKAIQSDVHEVVQGFNSASTQAKMNLCG